MFNSKKVNNFRIKSLLILIAILFLGLGIRLYYIQKKFNPIVMSTSAGNQVQKEDITDLKYYLLDKNGKDIFSYNKKYKVVIDSKAFKLNTTERSTQNIIAFNYIMKEQDKDFSYDQIMKSVGKTYYDVSEETYKKVNDLKGLKGVYAYEFDEKKKDEAWKIESILAETTGHDGHNNLDNVDKDENSLEMAIANYTKDNVVPKIVFERDPEGSYKNEKKEIPEGNLNVNLTLDKNIQDNVRKILNDKKYEEYKNIGVVLMEGDTGKIVSLAQKDENMPNIVLGAGNIDGYDPGSIFKTITLEAAMEYADMNLNKKVRCEGLICHKDKIHGEITLKDAFVVSCNDTFAKVGAELGEDKLINFAKKQGMFDKVLCLDSKTGMESAGKLPDPSAGIGLTSIGQSFETTLIQMTSTVSTIVNDGVYVRPYIVDSLENQKGVKTKKFTSSKEKVISKNVATDIKKMMDDVVNKGTGVMAKIQGVEIGGKTGTSQMNNACHGWFIGYFKMNNKYYSLGVFIPDIGEENSKGEKVSGGNTATPVFRDIVLELTKK